MVFKRGVALLVLAAALVSVEGAPIKVHTELKNPIVKDVKSEHGKLTLTLQEGAKVHKKPVAKHDGKKTHAKKPVAAKYADVKKQEVKKLEAKKPFSVKVASKKDQHKKHPEVKKHSEVKKHAVAKKSAHKQVSEEKKENGEVIRKYAHGQVRVMAKNQPAAVTDAHAKKHPHVKKVAVKKATKDDESNEEVEIEAEVKKSAHMKAAHKKVAAKKAIKADESNEEVEIEAEVKKASKQMEGEEDEEANVDLKVGEEVTIEFGGHSVGLELQANGSLILTADDETYVLPQADSVDLTFEEDELDSEASSGSSDAETEVSSAAGSVAAADDVNLLDEVEGEASVVAKKFTELATKLTGNGKFFSKEAAPVVFVGGVIGALAAIVGIAAIAIGRSRGDAAAADPASVLADATEDVEAGVSAENSEDAAADETQSLDSSDSESDAEEEQEEGKFANEVASV